MKINKITMTNFMPYKGQVSISFATDPFRNVTIIFGDNMRGKTSLLNAFRWGFYGQAVGRHSRPLPLHELPNKEAGLEGDWSMEVQIMFEANGHHFDLRRRATKKRYVAKPNKPDDFHCEVHLRKDAIPVRGDLVDHEINQIAPEQVSRFFLFDGELLQEYETLLIEGSQQGEKIKEAIEQVLGVPALTNGRDDIRAALKKAQQAQQKDLKQVEGLKQVAERQARLSQELDSVETELQRLHSKQTSIHNELTTLQDDIDAFESAYAAQARLQDLEVRQAQIESFRQKKRDERLELLSHAWRDLLEAKLSVKRQQLEARQAELIAKIGTAAKLESQVSNLRSLLSTDECPVCGQMLHEDRRIQIGSELGALEVELDQQHRVDDELQAVSAQLNALNKIRGTNAKERLAQIDRDLASYEVELTQVENDIEKIRDELSRYDTAEIARKRSRLTTLLNEQGRLQQIITEQEKRQDKLRKDIEIEQRTIEGATTARNQRSTRRAALYTELEKVFTQSIQSLRDTLRESVQNYATDAFRQMTTQKGYRSLLINPNYGLQIKDDTGDIVTLRSAGAEQVVALSLIDGLNRTGRPIGPVIMDTPFGRLDLKHRDNILRYLPKTATQLVLLVHSGEIRPETDLQSIGSRIGATYQICEISPRHSAIERTHL